MELSIPERLKDLRVERDLTLDQLAEQTHLSKHCGRCERNAYETAQSWLDRLAIKTVYHRPH